MIPLGDTPTKKNRSVITILFVIINCILFLYMLLSYPDVSVFFKQYGLVPANIVKTFKTTSSFQPVYWTFLSSMFSHGGWWHLISNMLFLWIFGDNVEDKMGKVFFLLFYLFAGVGASLIQVLIIPTSTATMVGASGAVSAIMGAYLVLFPKASVTTLVPVLFFPLILRIPAIVFMLIWFATQLIYIMTGTTGVGWGAHLGGFFIGILLGWIFAPSHKPTSARRIDDLHYFR